MICQIVTVLADDLGSKEGRMGAEDSDSDLPPSVFFTYRLEDREEHLSPQELVAATELGRLYPFLGSNGVPQHIDHASEAPLRKPVMADLRPVLREKSENCRAAPAAAPGKENLQPARGGRGGRRDLAGVHLPTRRRDPAAPGDDHEGKHADNNQQVWIDNFYLTLHNSMKNHISFLIPRPSSFMSLL